jgi:hypothetical protein
METLFLKINLSAEAATHGFLTLPPFLLVKKVFTFRKGETLWMPVYSKLALPKIIIIKTFISSNPNFVSLTSENPEANIG